MATSPGGVEMAAIVSETVMTLAFQLYGNRSGCQDSAAAVLRTFLIEIFSRALLRAYQFSERRD